MSSVSRAGPRGGKGTAKATDTSGSGSKPQKTDTKTDTPKSSDLNPKTQPTAEQMRIAQIIDTRTEDPDMKNKIKQVMDATHKSEDEVWTALHDCDNDLDRAVNMLLEGEGQGEWVTSGTKKKNRHPGATVSSTRGEKSDNNNRDRSEPGETGPDRERSRTRGGGPPRMRGRGSSDSRGWRGRENKENEKNLQEEGGREQGPPRRGGGGRMMNGPGRSGRGGRGGRSGPRTFQSREKGGGPGFPRAIDTWNPQGDAEPADAPTNAGPDNGGENWGDFPSPEDWDNEEYTGSLADTKVFTPSANVSSQPGVSQVSAVQSGLEARHDAPISDLATAASVLPSVPVGSGSLDAAASMLPTALTATGMTAAQSAQASKSLTPAQTQYFASLGTENLKAIVGAGASSGTTNGSKEASPYLSAVNSGGYQSSVATTYQSTPAYTATTVSYSTSTYGTAVANSATPSYSSQIKGNAGSLPQQQTQQQQLQQAQQPQQSLQSQARPKTQRTRLPPPSKIPSSAVEMPGDTTSSGSSFIDVQFGVDFGTDSNSFEFSSNNTAASDASGKFQSAASVGGLESSHVGPSSVGVQLDLSSMSLKGPSSQQQQAQVQQQQQQQVSMHQQQSAAQVLDGYSTSSSSQSSSVTAGQPLNASVQHVQHSKDLSQQTNSLSSISHSQKLSGADSMTFPTQVPEHKPSQAVVTTSYTQGRTGGGVSNTSSTPLDLVKSESSSTASLSYPNSSNSSNNPSSYQSSYQKPSSVYQSSTNYSSSAVSSGTGGSTGYSQGGASSAASQYQANQQSQNSGYSSSQSGYSSQATAFPSSASQPPATSYSGNTNSSSSYHQTQGTSGYQSTSYPSMSQPSSGSSAYQSSQQYQSAAQQQSYSASSGSTNYNTATGNSAASQYQNSYGSNGPVTTATALHGASSASSKLGSGMGSTNKDSQYDVPSTAGGSSSLGTGSGQGGSSVTPSSLGLVSSSGQATSNAASTKVTSSTAGVPPAMLGQHQYIMGQQGMPFYNVQQPIYGFDDYQHQLMQSRVPMQTASGFYDMSTLAAGRESGMTSVAYSVSDARFARTDNNSSPVPSTLSQQNPSQAHQQPMLNQTLPPGYAYFYGTGVVPGSFQYGTPALYQLPTATNAHGATNSAQYAKPATYSSGYGSGYDSLSGQGTADYSKASGGYVSAGSQGGQSSKGSVVGSAGSSSSAAASASDLTSNMYGKTHVALGKVNSYDKQGFHSGTPPPFSLPASQTSQMGAATGYTPLFIPTLAPHQQLHQPLHQMEFRNQGRRSDSSSGSGQRSQPTSQQSKTGVKQAYNTSYWAQN